MKTRVWILGAVLALTLAVGYQPRALAAEPAAVENGKPQGPYVVVIGVGAFKKLGKQNVVFMMDVQYKGGIDAGKDKVVEPSMTDYFKLVFGEKDDENSLPSNRLIVFGNPPFQDALTKGDHGLFFATVAAA